MHKKRSSMLRLWPVPRKGNVYLVTASHKQNSGIPVLVILREMLKIVKTRTEAKRIIHLEKVKVNNKLIKDEKYPLAFLDILSIGEKNYKLEIKNRKFSLEESRDFRKISKVIGKKILASGKTQVNLNDGRNFLANEKISTGDSVSFDFKDNKISKIIPMKEHSEIAVISGSHIGEKGKILKLLGNKAEVEINKEKINLKTENLMAI